MTIAAKAPAAPNTGATQAPNTNGPTARRLRKGELLFNEGDTSRAMYLIKSGMIRLYKKKGDSQIELNTVRSGEILGELAFLDGNPRSASAEALTDSELVEISGPTFQAVLGGMPDWVKILLKTVVGRLRAASNRIRQLESASTSFDYSEKDGKRSAQYVYLSPTDVMKICSAILLVGSRNGNAGSEGDVEIKAGLVIRYANQIMGVPAAKVTSMLDLLAGSEVVTVTSDGDQIVLKKADFLEQFIFYLNEQNLLDPSKRSDLKDRDFLVMSLIAKYLANYPKNDATGLSQVNIAEIRANEAALIGREPFRLEEVQGLVKLNYMTNLTMKSASEGYVNLDAESFMHAYRLQKIVMGLAELNEQKRKTAK